MNPRPNARETGFTLMELLIVVALIGLIAAGFLSNWRTQIERGQDARRKRDLANLERAFEEYANDNGCYPDSATYDAFTCGSDDLNSYGLKEFPCDPVSSDVPYTYVPEANPCDGYRIFTNLAVESDPDIARVGCDLGCVVGADTYNYGVSVGVPLQ